MNDQIKKQTNTGIALAIIGFAMVGGALVLIPRLVDEKIRRIQSTTASTACEPQQPSTTSGTTDPTAPAADAPATAPGNDTAEEQPSPTVGDAATVPSISNGSIIDPDKTVELVLVNRFEPDAASQSKLNAIIAMMKASKKLKLTIHGINNINKSSKLALSGANRIAATIASEANVAPERMEITSEQLPNIEHIQIKIRIAGGAQ